MAVPRQSTKIQVIGILNLVGGGLGLLGSVFSIISLLAIGKGGLLGGGGGNPINANDMQTYMAANATGYEAYQIAETAIGLLFDFMLLASGLGLLYYQKWARTTALVWAGLSLVNKVVVVVYTLLVVMPAMTAFIDKAIANMPTAQRDTMRMVTVFSSYGGICGAVIFSIYPIVVLCLLLSKSARQALEPKEYDDDHDRPDDFDPARERFDDRERRHPDDDRYRARGEEGDRY